MAFLTSSWRNAQQIMEYFWVWHEVLFNNILLDNGEVVSTPQSSIVPLGPSQYQDVLPIYGPHVKDETVSRASHF